MRRWCDKCKTVVQDGPEPHPCFINEPDMELELKVGDRVCITSSGSSFYGGRGRLWIPESQGGGSAGTVVLAAYRGEEKPGAAPRPYMVLWDNGVQNSYRVEDLELDPPDTEITIDRRERTLESNLIDFIR